MRGVAGIVAMPCRHVSCRAMRRIGSATCGVFPLRLSGQTIVVTIMTIVESLYERLRFVPGDAFNRNRLYDPGLFDIHDVLPFFLADFISADLERFRDSDFVK